MALRKDTDFAIQLLVFYGKKRQAGDDFVYRREVLHATGLNAEPQTRICRLLMENGFLEAKSDGRTVGYRLAVAPESITLKAIIELTENSTEFIAVCDKRAKVYSNAAWEKLQRAVDEKLESITVAELME